MIGDVGEDGMKRHRYQVSRGSPMVLRALREENEVVHSLHTVSRTQMDNRYCIDIPSLATRWLLLINPNLGVE